MNHSTTDLGIPQLRTGPRLHREDALSAPQSGHPSSVSKSGLSRQGDRVSHLGDGDGLTGRDRRRHQSAGRRQQGALGTSDSAQSRSEASPGGAAGVEEARSPIALRDFDRKIGDDQPPRDSGHVRQVVPITRLRRLFFPQWAEDVHYQRSSKNIDGRRIAARHPDACRALDAEHDPALHRGGRSSPEKDRGPSVNGNSDVIT
jgi:hypothetical protein